jgi:hypothetical protein
LWSPVTSSTIPLRHVLSSRIVSLMFSSRASSDGQSSSACWRNQFVHQLRNSISGREPRGCKRTDSRFQVIMTSVVSLFTPSTCAPLIRTRFFLQFVCAAMAICKTCNESHQLYQLNMVPSVAITTTAAAWHVPPKAPTTKADCCDDDPERVADDDVVVIVGSCATLGKANLVLVGVAVGLLSR